MEERDKTMNTGSPMIIIRGKVKTYEILSCQYNEDTGKWDVKFNNGKIYSYGYSNVEKLKDPEVLNPNRYRISRGGRDFFDISGIYVFKGTCDSYWLISIRLQQVWD